MSRTWSPARVRVAAPLLIALLFPSACSTATSAALDDLAAPLPRTDVPAGAAAGDGTSFEARPAAPMSTGPERGAEENDLQVATLPSNGPVRQAASPGRPDAAEIDYAKATAAGIFRRRPSQRAATFIAIDGPGYGLCLRAPSKTGRGYDHALIVFARRLNGQPISQVDDDTIVYRRPADAAPCRSAKIDWIGLVG